MTQLLQRDDILKILDECRSNKGVLFYDHIKKLLQKLVQNPNLLDLNLHEKVSGLLFTHRYGTDIIVNKDKQQQKIQWIEQCLQLLQAQNANAKVGFVQNFQRDSSILEWGGCYFGENETFWIQKSLNKLSQQTKAISIRFWGKILTQNKDYYVIESKMPINNKIENIKGYESDGVGCNSLQFWVTHNIFDEWIKLPQISPQQIKVSKILNIILTGNLENKINSFPSFPGQEKHYLKALLVRITYGTQIVPKDYLKINEENPNEIEFNDEFKMPELVEQGNIENWVFQHPCILNSGRATYPTDLQPEQLDELKEKDPQPERLSQISSAKTPGDGMEIAWLNRQAGDCTQQYNQIGADEGSLQAYGYQIIKNYIWPGSQTVSNTKRFVSIYIGYGQKLGVETIFPTQPNLIQQDPLDGAEEFEPNPKNPPKKAEVAEGEEGQEGEKVEKEEEEELEDE